ncbi:Signal transduction histidine kinase [Haloarcula vallismortis]|uniref:histidine kinase n=2 Tax=Haloarcula vallismortis TaxID=28442 RepID=M0IYR6_HALVA|nr:hybrid sensor histidine kinase/response regulator [Haloarcula vallismortis]EMA01876.1 HTR-like protein [Haloarcula vallismortis ATCC 29715]SDW52224.1 Signal transduction histidine kinase [Haloarcula vallismortis]
MKPQPTVLFVRSPRQDRAAISMLRDSGLTVREFDGVRDLERALDEYDTDCVVTNCEVENPDGTQYLGGLTLLDRLQREQPELPVILFAEVTNGDIAREAYSRDVFGYVPSTVSDAHQRLLAQVDAAVASSPARQRANKRKHLNEAVRLVNQALIRSQSRMDIERDVTAVLAGTDRYSEACTVTCQHDRPVVRALGSQRDSVTITAPEPLVRAESEDRLVVADIDPTASGDDTNALETDCVRALAVPLVYDGTSYGVLGVYADRVDIFDTEEQDTFREVGHNIALAIDASQTKNALQQRTTELEQQKERLRELAQIISHELRNPLQAAMGRVDLLAAEHAAEEFDAIQRSHTRMSFLIDDLMEIARQGGRQYTVEPVTLSDVMADAWTTVNTDGSTIEIDCTETILADSSRLCQLAENFFRLAMEQGDTGKITIIDTADGFAFEHDSIPVAVENEGPFELYYASSDEGVGLHLAVIREIAQGHGWEIGFSNEPMGRVRLNVAGVERPSAEPT